MVLRFLMRYLANNEQLVNKLAESKPVRRAAQFVVYLLSRSSALTGSHRLPSNSAEFAKQLRDLAQRFSSNVKEGIQAGKEELKRKQSK